MRKGTNTIVHILVLIDKLLYFNIIRSRKKGLNIHTDYGGYFP